MKTSCIILAGGAGKRMKSERPKVLAEVLCKPMLGWVLDSAEKFGFDEVSVVTGFGAELTAGYVKSRGGKVTICHQAQQKGTGDAVKSAEEVIRRCDAVCVLNGDAPFIDADTLRASLELHNSTGSEVTVITAEIDEPQGYGRIIRRNGDFSAIREQKDCSPEEAGICEVNSGAYWFSAQKLLETLPKLSTNNAAGEYYLTDCVEMMERRTAYKSANPDIVLGANTRGALLELNQLARLRKLSRLMDEGVSFITLDGIIIGTDVKIGCDTTILPTTTILGQLNNVQAYDSTVENSVKIGPFAQLRPGTTIREGVKIGDFVEIKNSDIGVNTAVAHLTYVGDSDVGRGVNFGCGCVTANYDGINKFRTKIGDHAFIGCNTNLIAPVEVGDNATTAAGSTITKNVPANSLAVERGQVRVIENWGKNALRKKK